MDTIWAFRRGSVNGSAHVSHVILTNSRYDIARTIKRSQDEFCAKALKGQWDGLGAYPEDLQWEALVDVLRGRVKASPLC